MRNSWDEILKNKLEHFEAEPPVDAWAGINKGIQTRKKKKAIWFLSIAAGFILLMGISWMFLQKKPDGKEIVRTKIDSLPQVADSKTPENPKMNMESYQPAKDKKVSSPIQTNKNAIVPIQEKLNDSRLIIVQKDSSKSLIEIPVIQEKEVNEYQVNVPEENIPFALQTLPIVQSEPLTVPIIPEYSSLGNAFNLAGTILNNDTGWKEELTSTTRKVEVTASLGFISFKKQSIYKLQ